MTVGWPVHWHITSNVQETIGNQHRKVGEISGCPISGCQQVKLPTDRSGQLPLDPLGQDSSPHLRRWLQLNLRRPLGCELAPLSPNGYRWIDAHGYSMESYNGKKWTSHDFLVGGFNPSEKY